jgi:acyl transferase domain-containing protein/acyl carrier protein
LTQRDHMPSTNAFPENAVAIIGMAGQFPDAPDLSAFWRNLTEGVESLAPLSDEELRASGVPLELIADPSYVKKATYLDGADRFDASFFGFNAREAEILDPQQRVFLECAWQAMEDAAYVPDRYPGSIGVFAGASMNTYVFANLLANPAVLESVGGYQTMISNDKDFLATRVSYKLNLHGPGITVQTACSTSLVAVQLAWQSLLTGQCDMALAGGVSVGFPQKVGYMYQEGMIFSPDGHCRPFDERGQGIRGGSGVGIVVLKRLADAIADRDQIHSVILGAAINNDGAGKMGYTAPSLDGQAAVITMAHANARVDAGSISYIEAHGTATPLGDPIEVGALSQVFRAGTDKRNFCALGSVKSNIGHLDAAAGIAGLIKASLSLEHGLIPASLNFEKPNPQIDFNDSPFYVNASLAEWKTDGAPRRAGVSSFGIGGTNAHAVLQEAPARAASVVERPAQLLLLSARSATALDAVASNLAAHIESHPDIELGDVAHTLQIGRKRFDHRRAVLCHDTIDAVAALRKGGAKSASGTDTSGNPTVAFMFSGQGSQYAGMGRDLYDVEPTFREELDRCAEGLKQHLGSDIRDLILNAVDEGADSELNQTQFAQPALFAFEYAVARTLMSWGVRPSAMIGHSIGEYVAATLSGVMSLDDALRLVTERGRLMQGMPAGRMLAIPLSQAEVMPLIGGEISLAAVNAPRLCVVAGPSDAVTALERKLGGQGIECRALHTSHAFHSAMMDPAIPPFLSVLEGMKLNAPEIPFISNLTGTWATGAEVAKPDYWARHLRGTVRFADGVRELARTKGLILIEVGPGKALATLARQTVGQSGVNVISSGRHPLDEQSDFDVMLGAVGQLWSAGVEINWNGFHRGERLQRIGLPTYPFERQRYMVDPKPVAPAVADALTKKSDIAEWFYVPSWKRVPNVGDSGAAISTDSGAWLVFTDDCGIGQRIIERVTETKQPCFTVRPGQAYSVAGNEFVVRPGEREDYEQLVENVRKRGIELRHVVHNWSVTEPESKEDLDNTSNAGLFSVISLMQALGTPGTFGPVKLTVISAGLQRIRGDEAISPAKSLVLGPCRVIPLEFPEVTCQCIDIDITEATDQLIGEIVLSASTATNSGLFAYRSGRRWAETFEHMPIDRSEEIPSQLRDRGVYLITGGLGGLGLVVARYLAATIKARLVLTGRSALPERDEWSSWMASHDATDATVQRIATVQELEALGAEVLVMKADVSVQADMERVAAEARTRFGVVHGVFHAAGTPGGALISLLSREAARNVLASKVEGTLILDSLFPENELDLLVLFSSINAIIGTVGATDYTAANAFLDSFANARNSPSRRVLAINWDAWQEVGMAAARASASTERNAARTLQHAIRSDEGLDALRRVLGTTVPQIAVITRDLPALIELTQQLVRIVTGMTDGVSATDNQSLSQHARPELDQGFVEPRNDQERFIAGVWQELLGLDRIGIDDNFFELGGHSLIATGMLARIHRELQVKLPLRTIFEASTVRLLAERVSELAWASQSIEPDTDEDGREEFEL